MDLHTVPDSASPLALPARRVLVVDDEEQLRHYLQVLLERAGFGVHLASDGIEALDVLARHPDLKVVLCDLRMPRMDGLSFLDHVRDRGLTVIAMSAFGAAEAAMEAVRHGAYDYISKPFRADEIRNRLDRVMERDRLEEENQRLRSAVAERWDLEGFIGRSEAAQQVMDAIRRVAIYPSTVLLTGESGTGKELLAHALHVCSPRAEGPFIAVNCAAIPESLLESELFGHERGAFTGAVRSRPGLFEQAHGGTLLLDEIGDMPSPLQTRLLRVLEDGRVRRIGGTHDLAIDVRLVAATAQRLDRAVADGRFREDLFYRLNVLHIPIPPLRERREDLPLLAETLVTRAAKRLSRPVPPLSKEAMAVLVKHDWPGNVRQLENALERAVVLSVGAEIRPEDLPPEVRGGSRSPRGEAPTETAQTLSIKVRTALLERELIAAALKQTAGNRSAAARMLEISYKALVYKIREYGIEP